MVAVIRLTALCEATVQGQFPKSNCPTDHLPDKLFTQIFSPKSIYPTPLSRQNFPRHVTHLTIFYRTSTRKCVNLEVGERTDNNDNNSICISSTLSTVYTVVTQMHNTFTIILDIIFQSVNTAAW